MPLRNVDWENDCKSKCQCDKCCGVNAGVFYYCDDPCPDIAGSCADWERTFNPETCNCDESYTPGGGYYTYTGVITDNPGDCVYWEEGTGDVQYSPDAVWLQDYGEDRCQNQATCEFSVSVFVQEPFYDSFREKFLYGAPGWANAARDIGGIIEGECCFLSGIAGLPYSKRCTRIRTQFNTGELEEQADSAGRIVARPYAFYYTKTGDDAYSWVVSVSQGGDANALANGGRNPAKPDRVPGNSTACLGTGWSLIGEWREGQ